MPIGVFLTYLGLVFLALSMNKHYKEVLNKNIEQSMQKFAKLLGFAFLIMGFFVFVKMFSISLGITYFVAILTVCVLTIAMILTYKAKYLMQISFLFLLLTLVLVLFNN